MRRKKDPAAVALGRKGGKATAGKSIRATNAKRTREERSIAAAKAWVTRRANMRRRAQHK